MFLCCQSELIKLPFSFLCSIGKVGFADPTGCQKEFHSFSLAAELGSTRIGGNDLSSGIAGVNGK